MRDDIELHECVQEIEAKCGNYLAGLVAELISDYESTREENVRLREAVDRLGGVARK